VGPEVAAVAYAPGMIINVDLSAGASVDDPAVFTAFNAISSTDDKDAVGAAMGVAGHAADDAGHVWVSAEWIRATVAGDGEWLAGFDAMVAFAESKGWMNEAGTHIKAHIEVA
jgi:hypothetical protein